MNIYPDCLLSIGLKLLEPFKTTNHHHDIECLLCGNVFNATPKSKMMNFKKTRMKGCPKCTNDTRFKTEKENMRKKLVELGFEFTEFRSKLDFIEAKNNNCKCGRWWKTKPVYLLSGNSFCRPCNDEKKAERLRECHRQKFELFCKNHKTFLDYRKLVRHHTEKNYKKHINKINPDNLQRKLSSPDKNGYHLDHIVSLAYCWKMKIPAEICGHQDNLRIISIEKNLQKNRDNINYFPDIFLPYLQYKKYSFDFIKYITENFEDVEEQYKIDDFYFDIKCNDILISFITFAENKESISLNKQYLTKLSKLAKNNGMFFIPIFEHEWINHREIVISKLEHILGKNDKGKLYARKTIIKEISSKDRNEFLEKNHLQGKCNSKIKLGAYYDDKLVSVMTFSQPRMIMRGKSEEGVYELVRFASDINYNVIGTASKLLKYFMKNYDCKKIYSFADKRWSRNGNLYNQLGFTQLADSDQNYYYSKDGIKFHHRFMFAKHNIKKMFPESFDEKLTEYQNMIKLGYDRIWDCGNMKFELAIDK
jgi:hypothetical protein